MAGGTAPYTWSLNGAPSWLTVGSSTGQLTGTAQEGSYSFDANVSSADGQSSSVSLVLVVDAAGPTPDPLVVTTSSLPNRHGRHRLFGPP